MGEQAHTQIEALPKPESQIEKPNSHQDSNSHPSPPNSDPNLQIPHPQPATSIPEASHAIPTEISHNNPSKIPIRPQKIRKLSAQTTAAVKLATDDSSISASSSSAPNPAAITPASAKNRRRSVSHAARALPQVIKPLSADGEIELAIRHLRAADPLLAPLIDSHPQPHFESHHPPFLALTKSILYQQLAYKAGTSIYTRFVSLCGGEEVICPDSVLALSTQQLKQIGVSGRKASYLYDLANKYKSGILSDETVVKMDDRSLFTMLSMVKGIGSWSVHMFMIFSLHRPDVLPVSDLGVRKGVQCLYGLEELPRPSQMEQLCEKWRPYRSVGAWYMWRFGEGKGTPASSSVMPLDGGAVQPLQQIEPHQDGHQHQHQLQFVEPVNGMGSIGACIWNQ
ncbi:alkylbase DNA glycosidase-like protein mag2 isoform X2 [Salvia splendens]|uniref:alkylbase DNA glycosidase-like protein mag2 isoform X2 n=1 Tax=Salvia splendens TaxID=180675 RepID=UPI001C27E9F1|nr:alkylbase DNA glycosidase-like protein mag2 isoform X2 [Salvia splendens]